MLGFEVILLRLFCNCLHVQIIVKAVHVKTILESLITKLSYDGAVWMLSALIFLFLLVNKTVSLIAKQDFTLLVIQDLALFN